MLQYKLIAIDLDDTLLNKEVKISWRNKEAICRAREKGCIVTIATGRMYSSALPIALELGIDVPLITYHGALVKGAKSGEVLINRPVPLKWAGLIIEEGYKAGIHMNLYVDDNLYVDKKSPEGIGYARLAGVELHPVGDLRKFLRTDPTKIVFIDREEILDSFMKYLMPKYGGSLYITKSKPHYLEVLHPMATKAQALKTLGEKFNIRREETMAIGDSFNDLDMIEFAGLGIVMGNSREEIKARADYITLSNDEDGVAYAIEKFVLQ